MKALLCATLIALAPLPSAAALSGFYDSAEKIAAILATPEVADTLRQAPVQAVEQVGTRKDGAEEWRLRSRDCDLKVTLVATPPKGPGKTTWRIKSLGSCR